MLLKKIKIASYGIKMALAFFPIVNESLSKKNEQTEQELNFSYSVN
ncbi:hypothetical protein SAMN04487898_10665 [Pedobacter sp. ok626]|nr:hypothetical protein SAMN04487898_10665 [Pedobacter sp. ok626]